MGISSDGALIKDDGKVTVEEAEVCYVRSHTNYVYLEVPGKKGWFKTEERGHAICAAAVAAGDIDTRPGGGGRRIGKVLISYADHQSNYDGKGNGLFKVVRFAFHVGDLRDDAPPAPPF